MIPWWGGVILFFAGAMCALMILALVSIGRDD